MSDKPDAPGSDLNQLLGSGSEPSFADVLKKLLPNQSLQDVLPKTMGESQERVRDFHKLIGAAISNRPKLLDTDCDRCRVATKLLNDTLNTIRELATDGDTLLSRLCLSLEETVEWLQAHQDQDLVAAADAIGDRAYVLFGDAVASGMPLDEIFEEIHKSNMTKAESQKDGLGKASKPSGYQKPDLELILSMASMNSDSIENLREE